MKKNTLRFEGKGGTYSHTITFTVWDGGVDVYERMHDTVMGGVMVGTDGTRVMPLAEARAYYKALVAMGFVAV